MHETEYTYAVARIRANELSLLTDADMDQLIAAADVQTAERILTDKGRSANAENGSPDLCENELLKAWRLISESIPNEVLFSLKAYLSSPSYTALTLNSPLLGTTYSKTALPSFTGTVAAGLYHTSLPDRS